MNSGRRFDGKDRTAGPAPPSWMRRWKDLGFPRRGRTFFFEVPILLAVVGLSVALGLGRPSVDSLEYRPVPDAAEDAWVALQMAHGRSPLLPIVNEWHPSRFSPVHGFLASLWVRLHGGRARALRDWSLWAVLGGCGFLYVWMILGGVSTPARLVALTIILFSPLLFLIARELLQEPTMMLLFWGTVLFWFLGARTHRRRREDETNGPEGTNRRRGGWERGACGLAGCGAMALTCIRPTIAPLFVLCLIHLAWVGGRRGGLRLALSFLAGGILCLLVVINTMVRTAGLLNVAAYDHWEPGLEEHAFHWMNLFRSDPRLGGFSRLRAMGRCFLGTSPTLSAAGWVGGGLLWIGMVLALVWGWPRRAGSMSAAPREEGPWVFRSQVFPLALFLASQVLVHGCYLHWCERFFVLMYPLFVVLGIVGLDRAIRWLASWGTVRLRLLLYLAVAVGTAAVGVDRYAEVLAAAESFRDSHQRTVGYDYNQAAHRHFGHRLRAIGAPIFIDRLPVLNARMRLGLADFSHPISQITFFNDLANDGHVVQFTWFRVGPPRGRLEPAAPWLSPPNTSCLIDPDTGQVMAIYLRNLLRWYGKVALYYPSSREKTIRPILEWADREGVDHGPAEEKNGWRLTVLRLPAPAPPLPRENNR